MTNHTILLSWRLHHNRRNVRHSEERRAADGRGIGNAIVTMKNAGGETRTARTNAFGYYRLAEVPAGESYILTVRSRIRRTVAVISVNQELTDEDFTALPD